MRQRILDTLMILTIATLSQESSDIVSEISAGVSKLGNGGRISLFGRSCHHSTEKVHIEPLLPGSK